MNKNNTSGHKGVNWSEEKNKWHAKISVNRKRIHLGYFVKLLDAAKAFEKAERRYRKRKLVET